MKALHLAMGVSIGLLVGFTATRALLGPPDPVPTVEARVERVVTAPVRSAPTPSCLERDALLERLHQLQPAPDAWPKGAQDPAVFESQLRAGAAQVEHALGAKLIQLDCESYPCVAVFDSDDPELAAVVRRHMGTPRGVATQHVDGRTSTAFSFTSQGVPQGAERTWSVLRDTVDTIPQSQRSPY